MMRFLLSLLVLGLLVGPADAQRRSRRQANWQPAPVVYVEPLPIPQAGPVIGKTLTVTPALDEVNATRAKRGLPPFTLDAGLQQAAEEAARRRASRLIEGHLPESDFSCLPAGVTAAAFGCAAWTPDWGWGACATFENYTYAGAAWAMGRDGRRFMHLAVR